MCPAGGFACAHASSPALEPFLLLHAMHTLQQHLHQALDAQRQGLTGGLQPPRRAVRKAPRGAHRS